MKQTDDGKAESQSVSKWVKASKGVRYREHPTRKHGKRRDRYYALQYKRNGKVFNEAVGWSSDQVTQASCERLLAMLRENWRTGAGPQTLAEMRQEAEIARQDAKEAKERQRNEARTFQSFFEGVYLPASKYTKKPSSLKTEEGLFKRWIAPVFGDMPLSKISPPMVEGLQADMLKAGKSPATAKYALAVISQVWNAAYMRGIVQGENPCRRVKKPKVDNRRMRFLTAEEARNLLTALELRSVDTHDACILSLFCGLRAGEIHALTWGDIDFDNGLILIRDPKNGKNRHAFMTEEVREMLLSRHQSQSRSDYVFVTDYGTAKKQISNVFVAVVNELGLNDSGEFTPDDEGNQIPVKIADARQRVVFHSLRHTFASWLVQAGTPLYTVAELMGHSTLEMTRRYSHLAPDTMKVAAMSLQGKLKEQKGNVLRFTRKRETGGSKE